MPPARYSKGKRKTEAANRNAVTMEERPVRPPAARTSRRTVLPAAVIPNRLSNLAVSLEIISVVLVFWDRVPRKQNSLLHGSTQ